MTLRGCGEKKMNALSIFSFPVGKYARELASYEAACQSEPILKSFDSSLYLHIDGAINSLADGIQVQSISMSTLKDVTGCLLGMNNDVVELILECQEDIWKNESMRSLVNLYFESSVKTLELCSNLDGCVRRVKTSQLMILQFAVDQFERELKLGKGDKKFPRTLEELKKFKEADDPFINFFDLFEKAYSQQILLLENLHTRKKELDKKLNTLKTWKRVSNVVFVTAFVSVMILTVVAAAIAMPPVVVALVGVLSGPIGSVGKWCDHLCKKYEKEIKGKKEIMASININTFITIKDLQNIRVLADKLGSEIVGMQDKADLAVKEKEEELVKIVMVEMKKQLETVGKIIEEVGCQVNKVSSFVTESRTVILQKIMAKTQSS